MEGIDVWDFDCLKEWLVKFYAPIDSEIDKALIFETLYQGMIQHFEDDSILCSEIWIYVCATIAPLAEGMLKPLYILKFRGMIIILSNW